MPASPAPLRQQPPARPHALPSQCPYCDQPITDERADEIRHRIEARARDQTEKLSANIRQQLVRGNALGRNAGLRIDHLLLSPALSVRLTVTGVDREVRDRRAITPTEVR